jgi:hypothetical protein
MNAIAAPPYDFYEQVEKDHGRIKHRRCFVFDQDYLYSCDCPGPAAGSSFHVSFML